MTGIWILMVVLVVFLLVGTAVFVYATSSKEHFEEVFGKDNDDE